MIHGQKAKFLEFVNSQIMHYTVNYSGSSDNHDGDLESYVKSAMNTTPVAVAMKLTLIQLF